MSTPSPDPTNPDNLSPDPPVAVITGAARGLGRGIATAFHDAGYRLLLCDRDEAVTTTAKELGDDVVAVRADVTSAEDVRVTFAEVENRFGRLDVLVTNAGIISIERLEHTTAADFERVLAVNTTGMFLCCQAAVGVMRRTGSAGRILNAASGQARQGFIYTPAYAASKFGVVGLTQSLAKELAPEGITVNAYCPGIVDTEMWSYNDERWGELLGSSGPGALRDEWVAGIPLGRAGTAADVAGLLLFLASPAASYITGQAINVDGGMFMS